MITLSLLILDSKSWIFIPMNKIIIVLIFFISFYTKLIANPNIQARTGILVDYHSDEILFELDADSQIYPASMTKIMTAIVAFDLVK